MSILTVRQIAIIVGAEMLGLGACLSLGALLFGQPAPPGQPQAASGTITVLVNGKPIATGGVLNLKSGSGVIAAASPNPALGGTDILFNADTAVMLDLAKAKTGALYSVIGKFDGNNSFTGSADGPPITSYAIGQSFVFSPASPLVAGSLLNVDGIGPLPLQTTPGVAVKGGECPGACVVIANGAPPKAWLIH